MAKVKHQKPIQKIIVGIRMDLNMKAKKEAKRSETEICVRPVSKTLSNIIRLASISLI